MKNRSILFMVSMLFSLGVYAEWDGCCNRMGGIHYCDSSISRYVCRNGDYSSCYCTRHATMDLQKFVGCCMWQGGVLKTNPRGMVVCNDGSISELCSFQNPEESIVAW